MFVEEETGDLLLQGWTVTNAAMLAEVNRHGPIADNESELIAATVTSAVHLEVRDDHREGEHRRRGRRALAS